MPEWWDVTDADGVPTGETFRRGDADWPPEGGFHIVATVCVRRDDGMLLLTRRAAAKDHPLTWELPGGSVLAGETSAAGAARELREKTGVTVAVDALTFIGRFTEESALLDLYVARAPLDCAVEVDPAEVADSEWVEPSEVERRWHDGMMAAPWSPRLEELWSPLQAVLSAG